MASRLRRATVLGVLALALVGCGTTSQEDRVTPNSDTSVSDAGLVSEALTFGEIALPPGAVVRTAEHEEAMDDLYSLVIEVPPDAVDTLLRGSGFVRPLREGNGAGMAPAGGFTIPDGPTVSSAQDRRPATATRPFEIFRDVLVDRSDPERTLVHIWAFST